ncbi:histamine H2 receptor [Eublepharis macularius]|uniref:Histamine H2 receptor n=1 Tax=Eublepharis macularius TaxID=481883 RepID=A0AA97J6K6_EUBMA|nr:histamine H2 receptor [Eublepharis macularius]
MPLPPMGSAMAAQGHSPITSHNPSSPHRDLMFTGEETVDSHYCMRNHSCKISIGIVLTVIIIVTICGNVVVCLAVRFNRRLRTLTNCFIVSLAVTDLMLGLLVQPFAALYEVSNHRWYLSSIWCNIYTSLDVMLCTASILNLFMISLDRYYVVTAPLRYTTLVTPRRVVMVMVFIWVVSIMVSFLPIHLGWNTNGTIIHDSDQCNLGVNCIYGLVDALLTFYIPLVIMCTTYYRIFKIAREQAKRINNVPCNKKVHHALPTVNEHKATVTLAIVMGAFIICWFPYFTVFIFRGIYGDDAVSKELLSVVTWLGYANSALNPILYGTLNRDFRTAYQQLFRCQRVGPDARKTPLTPLPRHQMRDKTCEETLSNQEDILLQLHERNGKENALTQDGLERHPNPPCDASSSTILSSFRSLWLAKFLPKRNVWIPVFDGPVTNSQKTGHSSTPHTVIYWVFS